MKNSEHWRSHHGWNLPTTPSQFAVVSQSHNPIESLQAASFFRTSTGNTTVVDSNAWATAPFTTPLTLKQVHTRIAANTAGESQLVQQGKSKK